jgi:hypothetical protein
MPNAKIQEPIVNSDTKVIDFSRMTVAWNGAKDVTQNAGASTDCTPSRPPWTTFTGILEARRDSPVGKRILAMDPKAIDGASASDEDLKKMHKRSDEAKKEWVRGVWFAPEDWKGIEV